MSRYYKYLTERDSLVYLIGAGPGDPSLITVRGLDLLRRADVVLYDRLSDPQLLLETKPDCVLIDVGKSAGDHTRSQDDITALLTEHGSNEKTVVRLKGGDPYLFGRGGEEAEALAEAGIPFAVVPGVSALVAATAYAGIPLTHREYASSVGIATGHGAANKDGDPVRWRDLAGAVDTVAVFMGVGSLDTIARELITGGMAPETPAAVIERGATPLQRSVTATLATVAEKARAASVKPPALFVAGPTVALAERLSWYRPGPLAGLTIGVTRPIRQSQSFADRLRELGAQPVIMPTIQVRHTIAGDDVRAVMEKFEQYDCVAFMSANGVDAFFAGLAGNGRDARALAGKMIAAIGPATAASLLGRGIVADLQAETFIAEGLVEAFLGHYPVGGKRVLLVRSNIGRETLREGLEQAGATVDQAAFYATEQAELHVPLRERIIQGGIDVITFTSSSTVDGLFGQMDAGDVPDTVKLASIGPETSAAIRRHGFAPAIEAEEYTTAGLARAIVMALGGEGSDR